MTAVAERVERVETPRRRVAPRAVLGGLSLLVLGAGTMATLYRNVPKGTAGDGPVDALVVLGTPAGLHGELTPMQIWRVNESVREFQRGRASHIVYTGGTTANRFVEAEVMTAYAS